MQDRSAACCAAVSWDGGFTVVFIFCPPVFTVSVIVGTVPVSCSACSESAPTAEVTPEIFATSLTATLGKVMRVPFTKKSWVNLVPGFPSFARSVITEELALARVASSDELSDAAAGDAPAEERRLRHRRPRSAATRRRGTGRGRGRRRRRRRPGATVRVTMMSVPTVLRGERIWFWASERPSETPMMPITSPTPAARPIAVTIRSAKRGGVVRSAA